MKPAASVGVDGDTHGNAVCLREGTPARQVHEVYGIGRREPTGAGSEPARWLQSSETR